MSSAYFKLRVLKRSRLNKIKCSNRSTIINTLNNHQSFVTDNKNKCRVCLKEGTVSIFSGQNSFNICEAIKMFTDIEITLDDAFPKFLCQSCYSLLQGAVMFRNSAKLSDSFLRCNSNNNDDEEELFASDQSEHSDNESFMKSYACNTCELKFNSLDEYVAHRNSKIHKNIRVQCSVCKGILTSQFYKKHLARHRTESHLICEVCGKLYRKDNLLRHLQLHNYDLPYQCQVCPYRGRFLESLKIHMRTHTGEKPFSCDECKLCFLTRSNLNRHLLIHNKEKQYKCVECSRGFYTKRDMDVHFKADHVGVKDFLCKLCGNKYGTRKALMRHELRVHKRTKLAKGRMPLYLQAEYKTCAN